MSQPDSPVVDALRDLALALSELGCPWYLFGAQAALLYGSSRLTADVDATVLLENRSTRELTEVLTRHGFSLRITDDDFVARTRVVPVVHGSSGLPADLVLGGPGLEELFAGRCVQQHLLDVLVPVARPEDIVVMKVLADREKDRLDVQAILAARLPELDLGLIRETLALLEQALDQSDLTPAFERLLARARAD